ncbi:MAG: hypothetical protein ACREVD_13575 [Burkholderiales bacterium]
MNSLWISIAQNVRKALAARGRYFHPQSRTCGAQLSPSRRGAQVDGRAGFFALAEQLACSINYY